MLADHLNPHFSTLTPDSLAQTSSVSITYNNIFFLSTPKNRKRNKSDGFTEAVICHLNVYMLTNVQYSLIYLYFGDTVSLLDRFDLERAT